MSDFLLTSELQIVPQDLGSEFSPSPRTSAERVFMTWLTVKS